ncbi:serine/threonine-protein phosphatase [Micromonospora noduli]|uniref:PP2C family protein-serine/threonine phosphatase n=1 Tax=Micromonospora noduli TaxID=709876 RepID=UPI000DC3A57A|nr:PP2C family protein-serine/threonine phosphatase [Micromonospora noduli]KAB1922325.1 serine/threonine-protein phosphatase [Micromonospora noduli]RAO13831.1 Non-specific serine/threonine protein kinase [Micromonospora noduli]RAO36946.1 Non-specific serine/threonine protein kinase [Micromonospora noduli]
MTASDVRDWDPGDGRLSTPSTTRPSAWSADVRRPTAALPPLAPDRGQATPDWLEVVEHFREGLVVCDADGVVRHVSPVAERLLPEVTSGELLSAAGVPGLSEGVPGSFTHRGRRLTARQVPLSGDRCCWYVEDVTDSVSRADALLAERARSAFLAVVGDKLGNPLHPDRAAAAVVRLAVPTLAEVAVLVLAPRAGRARWWRASRTDDEVPTVDSGVLAGGELPTAIADGLTGAEPHAVDWLVEQAVDAGWLPGLAGTESAARVVPLPGRDEPVGVLLVARRATRWYDEDDVELVRAFAARAGAALTTALLYRDQAEVADTLQASLLPVEPAEAVGVQWGTAYRPAQAGLRIGGDFYGSHRLTDGGSVFFLGDVSGKGVEAAVFTGQLRQCLQALHRLESNPARLLRLLNDALLETTQAHGQGRFATIVLGVARPERDGGLTLTMAGGGHLPPLVLRASGEVETVPLRGMLIGVVPDPRVGEVTVRLAPGETCLLYSDGVTEARGGRRGDEQFGPERLVTALTGCQRMPAPALAERVEQITCDWLAQGDHDDIAVLALRAAGLSGRGARHLHSVPAGIDQTEETDA